MQRSTDRILTTHVGALQRPPELSKALAEQGERAPEVLAQLRTGVADVVRRQVEAGLDVIDDGEFGKTMWSQYVRDQFPGFYAWAAKNASLFGYMDDSYFFSPVATRPVDLL